MGLKIAFVGFRHGHIHGLYRMAKADPSIEVVGVCEEDEGTRKALADMGVQVTHETYERMLDDVECDAVACGDYFGIRGDRLIQAMERGRHVIADKPVCTCLEDLDRIRALAASKGLRVGCLLDLGCLGPFLTLREVVRRGSIGEVHTITFLGQHPLNYGTRPAWYFQEGKHGGTINDIAIHAIDLIPALTGRRIVEVTAARAWNARLHEHTCFQDGAILMLRLDNDGGVVGDVSYLSPDGHGYQLPAYWRFTLSGTDGLAETSCTAATVNLWRRDTDKVIEFPAKPHQTEAVLEDFLNDLAGKPRPDGLNTERVLESARIALLAQRAADTGAFPQPV